MNDINTDPAQKPFAISRTFDTTRDKMWQAWSECDREKQWFGPSGSTMPVAKMDFRPGGSFHYCLRSTEGQEIWGKFVYREIAATERIVLVNSFSDAEGNLTCHPMAPTWPLEMLSKLTIEGKSRAGRQPPWSGSPSMQPTKSVKHSTPCTMA